MRLAPAQRGMVLVLGLIFLAITSVLVLSSMRITGLHEKINANHQKQTVALLSAEYGASRFMGWLIEHHQTHGWPQTAPQQHAWQQATQGIPHTAARAAGANVGKQGIFWIDPADVVWTTTPPQVTVTVRGHAQGGDALLAEARISKTLRWQPPPQPYPAAPLPAPEVPLLPPLPAALTLAGPLQAFLAPDSNRLAIRGGPAGPALATDQTFPDALGTVLAGIPPRRVSYYSGATGGASGGTCALPCITAQDLGATWSEPARLQALVSRLSEQPDVQWVRSDMDTHIQPIDNNKAVVIVQGRLTLRGRATTSDGTGIFNGTLIVLGGAVHLAPGSHFTLNGQMYLAHIDTSLTEWQFRPRERHAIGLSGSGHLTLHYQPAMTQAEAPGSGTVQVLSWAAVDMN